MSLSTLRTAAAVAVVALVAGGGGAALAVGGSDSTTSVGPRTLIASPANSPADFPGVRTARAGKPLPRGYVAVGHTISITRGQTATYPTFTLRCPKGKRLKTFAHTGDVVPQIVGRSPFVRRTRVDYIDKPTWGVVASFNSRTTSSGETVTGTVYGLCR